MSLIQFFKSASISACLILAGCGGGSGGSSTDESSSSLSKPSVSVQTLFLNGNSSLEVLWDNSNASQYRVIYWRDGEPAQFFTTSDTEFTSPNLAPGDYTVIVEAYDEQGNSLFSDPATVAM